MFTLQGTLNAINRLNPILKGGIEDASCSHILLDLGPSQVLSFTNLICSQQQPPHTRSLARTIGYRKPGGVDMDSEVF